MILQQVAVDPVQRTPLHADFFVVKMSEEMIVEVPISFVGESEAVKKHGGTLLHQRETVSVRALPDALPSEIEVDISVLEDFESTLHVSDVIAPAGVTILTEGRSRLLASSRRAWRTSRSSRVPRLRPEYRGDRGRTEE